MSGRSDSRPALVDAHAHFDLLPDLDAGVEESVSAGLEKMLAVGVDLASSRTATDLAARYEQVWASVGVHPHDAEKLDSAALEELKKLAGLPRTVAIGETGLDFYRNLSPPPVQKEAFHRQIELARETGLTLMVHTREAGAKTLGILKDHAEGVTVVLHCFSLAAQVEECIRRGYFMSVAGNVTFKNATALKEAVRLIPPELLLTETDSPYLAPVPFRGKPNRPALVRQVIEEVSRLREEPIDELAACVSANFDRAFKIID